MSDETMEEAFNKRWEVESKKYSPVHIKVMAAEIASHFWNMGCAWTNLAMIDIEKSLSEQIPPAANQPQMVEEIERLQERVNDLSQEVNHWSHQFELASIDLGTEKGKRIEAEYREEENLKRVRDLEGDLLLSNRRAEIAIDEYSILKKKTTDRILELEESLPKENVLIDCKNKHWCISTKSKISCLNCDYPHTTVIDGKNTLIGIRVLSSTMEGSNTENIGVERFEQARTIYEIGYADGIKWGNRLNWIEAWESSNARPLVSGYLKPKEGSER